MYQSKAAGRNSVSFFDRDIQDAFTERMALYTEIQEAIQAGQFVIHYHPLAEQNRQIIELDHWVLIRACRQLAAWAISPYRAQPMPLAEFERFLEGR